MAKADSKSTTPLSTTRPTGGQRTRKKAAPERARVDLNTLPDTYALVCEGTCMSPVIFDRAVIAVSKLERPVAGDYVVIWHRPENLTPGMHQAQLKRLTRNLPSFVKSFPFQDHPGSEVAAMLMYERFQPPARFAIACSKVFAVHKAIGLLPRSEGAGGVHDPADVRPFPELVGVS